MSLKICFPFIGDSVGGSHISALILIKKLKTKGNKVKVLIHENLFLPVFDHDD